MIRLLGEPSLSLIHIFYATRMTLGLVRLKLEEHKLLDATKLVTCEAGDVIQAGKFSVEFILSLIHI